MHKNILFGLLIVSVVSTAAIFGGGLYFYEKQKSKRKRTDSSEEETVGSDSESTDDVKTNTNDDSNKQPPLPGAPKQANNPPPQKPNNPVPAQPFNIPPTIPPTIPSQPLTIPPTIPSHPPTNIPPTIPSQPPTNIPTTIPPTIPSPSPIYVPPVPPTYVPPTKPYYVPPTFPSNPINPPSSNQPTNGNLDITKINTCTNLLSYRNNDCYIVAVLQSLFNIKKFLHFLSTASGIIQGKSNGIINLLSFILESYIQEQGPVDLNEYRDHLLKIINNNEYQSGRTGDSLEFCKYLFEKIYEESSHLTIDIFTFVLKGDTPQDQKVLKFTSSSFINPSDDFYHNFVYEQYLERTLNSDTSKISDSLADNISNEPFLLTIIPDFHKRYIDRDSISEYVLLHSSVYRLRSVIVYVPGHYYAVVFDDQFKAYEINNGSTVIDFRSGRKLNISAAFYEFFN